MRTYRPGHVPDEPAKLPAFLRSETQAIQAAAGASEPFIHLDERHVAPDKLFTGLVILADGTDFDPGAGAGVYVYYGAAWHKLG